MLAVRNSPSGSIGPRDALARYGVAVVATAGGLTLRRALSALWDGELPYLALYPAVLASVWYGGIGPGLAAIGLSVLGAVAFWLRPDRTLAMPDLSQGVGLVAFMVMNVAICLVVEGLRRARSRAEATAAHQEFLARVSTHLGSSLDYEVTLRAITGLAVPYLADWCSVDVVEANGLVRRLAVACADPSKDAIARRAEIHPPDPHGRHPRTRVLRTGESILIPEVTDEMLRQMAGDGERLADLRALAYRSGLVVPLIARGDVLGALSLATAESGRTYGRSDLALAEELGRRAGIAVDNARLFREAQEANQLKDEFIATVSHELRTPLQSMLGWVKVLRQGRLTPERSIRAFDVMERAGQAQARLIEDMLDVSRIATGRLRLESSKVDLGAVLQSALDAARPAADAKKVHLEMTCDPDAAMVAGDAVRLQQVAWNLLSNAVKFTPGGGRVEVRLQRDRGSVRLIVRDTGEGIDPVFIPYVFEPFRQADATSRRRHGGLGLGLAIVRRLVELHGGSVTVRSDGVGFGSEFCVCLPVVALPDAGAVAEKGAV